MNISEKVLLKLNNILADIETFPEDDWYSISDTLDVNLYVDESGKACCTVFPVDNGQTITTREFVEIPIKSNYTINI